MCNDFITLVGAERNSSCAWYVRHCWTLSPTLLYIWAWLECVTDSCVVFIWDYNTAGIKLLLPKSPFIYQHVSYPLINSNFWWKWICQGHSYDFKNSQICLKLYRCANKAEQILSDHIKHSQTTHSILPALLKHVIWKYYRTGNVGSITTSDWHVSSFQNHRERGPIVVP